MAKSNSAPVAAVRKNGEIPSRFIPLVMRPSVMVPRTTPVTLPVPPANCTPPIAMAVIESKANEAPTVASPEETRPLMKMPAIVAATEQIT